MFLTIVSTVAFIICTLIFLAKVCYICSTQYLRDQMVAGYMNKRVVVFGLEAWFVLAIWVAAGAYLFS